MIRVLVVDDHESVCDALTLKLESTGDFTVVGKLPKADQVESFCNKLKPDIIIMDVCTGGSVSGLDSVKEIKEKYPEIKVIVMTGFDEITYAPRAKEAGANAFVFKSKSLEYFSDVAKGVMRGETYYPEPAVIPMPKGEAPLSVREMEVLRLLCKHMSSKDIAEELNISINTVYYHKKNMMAKTGFSKMIDLTYYMVSNGWVNPRY